MNTDVFDSINKLKKVFAESQQEYLFTSDIPETPDTNLLKVAESNRDKMIEILNQFYKEHYQSSDGVDDFVTLFGAYCNYYILYGLHLILKEDDFGTTKIFENISNESLERYLSLIRSAICTQDIAIFEEAVEKDDKYSLAHFYLFLFCLRKYWSHKDYAEQEKELLKHYRAIRNEELKKYALGNSDFIPSISNYIIETAKNFLSILVAPLKSEELIKGLLKTNNASFDAPPLPSPYLMTNEEWQRVGYLINAYLLWINFRSDHYLFTRILFCKALHKDFSDTLSFIVSEGENWNGNDEALSNLLAFFKERNINLNIAEFICYMLFVVPEFLDNAEEILLSSVVDDPKKFFPTTSSDFMMRINIELEKIYSDKQPIISGIYDTMEKAGPETDGLNNKYMIWRSLLLNIPYLVKWNNQELSNLMERISVQDEKNTMVKDFMHTYSNMKADALREIAELLLKRDNPEDKRNGRNLLMEYAVKKEIKNSVYMMQLMYKNSAEDIEKLKEAIMYSIVDEEDDHESVRDVLNKSLIQCFINIFYIDPDKNKLGKMNSKIDSMRTNFKQKTIWGEAFLGSKRDQFEQQFTEQDFDCLAWLSQGGINFTFEQEPIWEGIFLEKESYGSTFFKIIFDELCVNVFKYANLKEEIRLFLSENGNKGLVIFCSNYNRRSRISDSKIGLNLLRRRIQILYENPQKNCVEIIDANNKFQIKLFLPKELFLN